MTTRTIVRTPRRRKLWANRSTFIPVSDTQTPQMDDQLDPTFTDLGLTNMAGVTVMRMVGAIAITQWISGAAVPTYNTIRLGWAWIDQNLAAASPGDAQIPKPVVNGTRQTRWYHQEIMGGLEQVAPIVVSTPLGDSGDQYRHIDVTNMHKQRGADQRFMLVIHHDLASEANTMAVRIDLSYLIALP